MATILDRERTVAGPGFNRWLIPPAALAIHLCIGQVYATSVYKTSLVACFGTSLTAIGVIFSVAIVMLGLSAAVRRHVGRAGRARARRWRCPPPAGRAASWSVRSGSPPNSSGCCTSATA